MILNPNELEKLISHEHTQNRTDFFAGLSKSGKNYPCPVRLCVFVAKILFLNNFYE